MDRVRCGVGWRRRGVRRRGGWREVAAVVAEGGGGDPGEGAGKDRGRFR